MSAESKLEQRIRSAFEGLAADRREGPQRTPGAAAPNILVRVASFDADARFAHVEEERVVAHAIPARRREFATGRRLAHELLAELGHASAPLLPGKRRAPDWPAGVVGSISHARGIAAVALAPRPQFTAIGLDVEGAEALSPELIGAVLTAGERERYARLDGALGDWAKLDFCAKECVYKAWSPALAAVPEFTDVEIDFDAPGDRFTARLMPRAGMPFEAWMLRGRYARCDERVCAVTLDFVR